MAGLLCQLFAAIENWLASHNSTLVTQASPLAISLSRAFMVIFVLAVIGAFLGNAVRHKK